jgi:hypothetical protein
VKDAGPAGGACQRVGGAAARTRAQSPCGACLAAASKRPS